MRVRNPSVALALLLCWALLVAADDARDSNGLVILLRGMTFRAGGNEGQKQWSGSETNGVSASQAPQGTALTSFAQHVLAPSARARWNVSLFVDAVVPSVHVKAWNKMLGVILGHAVSGSRVATTYRTAKQGDSVRDSLSWIAALAPDVWDARGALLLARVDLVFKTDLPLPAAPDPDTRLIMPFAHLEFSREEGRCILGHSDTVIWVPRAADAAVARFLACVGCHNSLHSIAMFTGKEALGKRSDKAGSGVRTFFPEANADADSSASLNPLYYIIGRPQSTRVVPRPACNGPTVDKG